MQTTRRTSADTRDEEFSAFVAGSGRRLVHIARLIANDEHRAEDLAQSALLGVYKQWGKLREQDPFAYARRSIINEQASWWKRRLRWEIAMAEPPDARHWEDPRGVEQRDSLRVALAALTARERAVVVLRHVEDLSEQQTAAELGIAVGTVKSTSSRALAKLRASAPLTDHRTGPGA